MQIVTSAERQPKQTGSREVESSLRQILDLSPDAVIVQANNKIVFVNSRALNLFRADSAEQLLGHSLLQFLHPETKLLVKTRLENSQKTGEGIETFKHQIIALDGSVLRVGTTASLIVWDRIKAIQIRLREVSSQTDFEIRLRESETLFHQLADAMPQIVWMANKDGIVDYHNKKWFEQTRLTEEEANAIGLWKAILHPDDAPLAAENWNRCVRTGEPFQMEYRYKDLRSGGHRWHLGRALPVRDENNKIVRWFGTCTDIHDQKLTEIALQQAKEQLADNAAELEKLVTDRTIELEDTVRSSEALNYSIAHDLRAPLRAMMGFADTLLDEYSAKLDASGQEYARRISAAAKRMDNLINALLAYGRLNYEELSFGFINTGEMLETLFNDFQSEIKSARARIILTKPFPQVWANAALLKKVFVELIENALKFRSSERPLRIEIWAEEQESKNLIWIRDNGIGIAPEHHERIFRVLESLHARNKYSGTGIGLAIVKRAIERMDGSIGLKSAPDEGSCFWIELPKALV
jgi:PAS domain S-box-containing protein